MFDLTVLPKMKRLALVLVALAATAAPSPADTLTYAGATSAGGPTFNRPQEAGTALSPTGTNVPYSVLEFRVSQAGAYEFLSTPASAGFDNFLILYAEDFDRLAPLANFVIADDDLGGVGLSSGFTIRLRARTAYFLVTTGFLNDDFGEFSNRISGSGTITPVQPVPEPATMLLVGTGLAGLGAAVGRRRSRSGAQASESKDEDQRR